MNVGAVRVLQAQLRAKGAQPGAVDGRMSAATRAAIARTLARLDPETESDWHGWPVARQDMLCLQALCREAGLDAGKLDGWWGPQTEFACSQLGHLQADGQLPPPWRDSYPVPANPHGWPLERQADLIARYGKPGANLVPLELPYPLRLAWDTATQVARWPSAASTLAQTPSSCACKRRTVAECLPSAFQLAIFLPTRCSERALRS